jgi:hypothetical protein
MLCELRIATEMVKLLLIWINGNIDIVASFMNTLWESCQRSQFFIKSTSPKKYAKYIFISLYAFFV